MMARQAKWMKDLAPNKVSTGAANTYTITSYSAPGGANPPDGMTVGFIAHQANAGASNLVVDSYGGRPLRAVSGTALTPGAVQASMPITATYRAATNEWIAHGTGANINAFMAAFQSADLTARLIRVGSVFPWFGAALPSGYLYAAGQAVSRTTYNELFAAYGTTYGAGDGATTFNLPDLRGRALFGKDNMNGTAANRVTSAKSGIVGTTLGASGGTQSEAIARSDLPNVTLTDTLTVPAHNHGIPIDTYSPVEGGTGSLTVLVKPGTLSNSTTSETTDTESAKTLTVAIALNGGVTQTETNNMPPAMVCNWIILASPSAARSLVTSKGTVTAANGLNSNIAMPSNESVRLDGPSAAFSLGGFTAGVDGQPLYIYNTTAQAMTIVNEDASSTAANRIKTLTGANVTLRTGTSYASFEYDGTDARWVLRGTN